MSLRRRHVAVLVRLVAIGMVVAGIPVLALQSPAAAAAWSVSSTADTPVGESCAGFTDCSLRQAITAAEANPGVDTILVSGGTYTLSNGPIAITQDLTIARVGATSVTIDTGGGSGVFTITGGEVILRHLRINGSTIVPAVTSTGPSSLSIESTTFAENTGRAIQSTGSSLTIGRAAGSTTSSAFSNNTAVGNGGAVSFISAGPLSISDTTFSANASTQRGGAVYASGSHLSITRSNFVGNSGSSQNGAIFADGFLLATIHHNRFHGNGFSGDDVFLNGLGTVQAERNWYGCNSGPGTVGCESIAVSGGATLDADPWLVLGATGPSFVDGPSGTATISAGTIADSDGDPVDAGDRPGAGATVTWSSPLPSPATVGSTSTISEGTRLAATTYNSQTAPVGPGAVTATLDNQSVTAGFTVRHRPVVTDDPDDTTVGTGTTASFTAAATGDPTPTVQWQESTDDGGSWNDLAGEEDPTLSFVTALADDGNRYRAVFTSAAGTDTSDAAVLTVTAPPLPPRSSPTVAVAPFGTSIVYGQEIRATATVTGAGPGSVQFSLDGANVGSPVPISGGTATSPDLSPEPGQHTVTATYLPANPAVDGPGSGSQDLVVGKASTTVVPSVQRRAVKAVVAAGSGVVMFNVDGVTVGTAPVVDGVARLAHVVPPGTIHQITVDYSGDDRYEPATGSVTRSDPTLTAEVRSRVEPTRFGWYRVPVRITYACQESSAPLVRPCPSPKRLRADDRHRAKRTIRATDGGAATVTLRVRIDKGDPLLRVRTTPSGDLRCVASDPLSGIRSCRITETASEFRAVAFDKAGNRTVVRGRLPA